MSAMNTRAGRAEGLGLSAGHRCAPSVRATIRMATQIVQIDLAQPLPTIRTGGRYTNLWILVRFGRQPLGWVRCRNKELRHKIMPDLLAQLIAEALYLQVHDAARLRS